MKIEEKFTLGEVEIIVSEEHRFGTDAFLLAEYASPKRKDLVCDLCSGCGIIPLLFCKERKQMPKKVYGVELQNEAAKLFSRSIEHNGLIERVFAINADLRRLNETELQRESFDMVTINPPYFKANSGEKKLSEQQAIARHEICCTPKDFVIAADYLLKYGGMLKLCHVPERLCDIMTMLREHKLEPKNLTLVQNLYGQKPWLFLLSAKKGGSAGMTIETKLLTEFTLAKC